MRVQTAVWDSSDTGGIFLYLSLTDGVIYNKEEREDENEKTGSIICGGSPDNSDRGRLFRRTEVNGRRDNQGD